LDVVWILKKKIVFGLRSLSPTVELVQKKLDTNSARHCNNYSVLSKRYEIGSGGVALPRITSLEQDIPLLFNHLKTEVSGMKDVSME
jgi:hypothetical protein